MTRRLLLLALAGTSPARVIRSLVVVLLVGVLGFGASANATPAKHSHGGKTRGCEVEAEGSLSAKRSFKLEAALERGRLDGELEFRDKPAKLDFEATTITSLVVTGKLASVQGRGKPKGKHAPTLRFSATLDAAARTFALHLSSGYSASGALAGKDDEDDEIELKGSCPFDGASTPILDTPRRISATIGRDGGVLAGSGLTLTIPPGALSEDTTIALTPLVDLADSPLAGTIVGGAKLEPEGLRFLSPAVLTLALPAGTAAADIIGFGSAGDGSELHLQPHSLAGGAISLQLWHFSTAGASSGGAAAAAALQSHQPSTAETRALQRIAAAEAACAAEQGQGTVNGPACTQLQQETVRALFDWYTASVRPGLEQAVGAPSFQVEAALGEWMYWQQEVEARLNDLQDRCGSLANECNQAGALATQAVADMARRRLQNCTGTSLPSQLRDVARVADFVVQGAIDLTSAGLPADLLHACAHLKIKVLDFPAVAALLYSNTLRGRVTVAVYTGNDRTDVPFNLTVDGESVSAAADGSFQTTLTPTAAPLNVRLEAEATNTDLQTESFGASEPLEKPARDRVELQALSQTTIGPGGTVTLRVRVAGDGMAGASVDLTVDGPGSVNPDPVTTNADGEATTVYTAPSDASGGATVTATHPDGATANTTITFEAPITVTVSPAAAILGPGGTAQFTATTTGTTNTNVTWNATGGTISATGLYTAGSTPGSYSVTASSVHDPTTSGTATITISSGCSIVGRYTVASVTPAISTQDLQGAFVIETSGPAIDLTGDAYAWKWIVEGAVREQSDNPFKGPYVGDGLGNLRHVNFRGEFPGPSINGILSADCNQLTATWTGVWSEPLTISATRQ